MRKTIVRAYSLEITGEDVVRMKTYWRNLHEQAEQAERDASDKGAISRTLVDLTDNGNRSFGEWLYMAYEAATYVVDGGDHSGALYWEHAAGGWVTSDLLYTTDDSNNLVYSFGPITFIHHGMDGNVEAEHEDRFYEGLEPEQVNA